MHTEYENWPLGFSIGNASPTNMIILFSKKKKRQKSELEIQNATKRTNPAYIESCLHYKKLTKFHELTNESKITISVREDLNLNSLYEIYQIMPQNYKILGNQ